MVYSIQDFQPVIFSLVGVFVLALSYPKTIRRWKESPPQRPSHFLLRLTLSLGVLLALSFVISRMIVPDDKLVWVNTLVCFFLFAAYAIKLMFSLRKYSRTH